MTSRFSTFPYSAQECKAFLGLLRTSQDLISDGHMTCVIARLWSLVFNHRLMTHYGEQYARLSRDQALLVDLTQESRALAAVTSLLSFGASERYRNRLDDIFTDNLVYAHQWQLFISGCLREWRESSYLCFMPLLLHIPFVFVSSSIPLTVTSGVCLGTSIISSTLLLHCHEALEDATATQHLLSPLQQFS